MTDTTYVDYTQPAVNAEWLNEVNNHIWHDTPVQSTTVHTAANIANVPAGTLSATTVQTAINEIVSDLASTSGSSLVGFIQDGLGAVAQTVQAKGREKFTAQDMGCVGDGIIDDTTNMQLALNYASSSGKELDLGGSQYTYKITSALTGGSNLHIQGSGATIDMSGISSGARTAIICAGSAGNSTAITGGATENSYTVTVANTAGFSVGDYIQLDSANVYDYGAGSYNVARGEIKCIRSMVANTSITFTTPLIDTYSTSPRVRPITWVDNVTIRGIRIVGFNAPATAQRGIALRYVKNFHVSDNEFNAQDTYQVECASSILGNINDNHFTGVYYNGTDGTIFYGIAVLDCSQWIVVSGNIGNKVRHLVVTTSRTSGQGFYGQPTFINIHHNICYDAMAGGGGRSFAYESHGFGRFTVWDSNQAHGCYSGFNIDGGQDIIVSNNQITGYAHQGIIIGEANSKTINLTVINNTIDNYTAEVTTGGQAGIGFVASDEMSNVVIANNTITNATNAAAAGVGSGIYVIASTVMRGVVIRGNTMTTRLGVEATPQYAIVVLAGSKVILEDNHTLGWRQGINITSTASAQVLGGSIRNYANMGAGYGVVADSSRVIVKNVHFENIYIPLRCGTSSSNCLITANTMTGCTTTTPSDAGTSNTTTLNFVV